MQHQIEFQFIGDFRTQSNSNCLLIEERCNVCKLDKHMKNQCLQNDKQIKYQRIPLLEYLLIMAFTTCGFCCP